MLTEPYLGVFDPKADSPLADDVVLNKKHRYQTFDAAAEIDRISRHVFGKPCSNFSVMGSGVNTNDHNVYVATVPLNGTQQEVVFRINTTEHVEGYLLVEALVYEKLRTAGIPIPTVHAVQLRDSKFPYDFMVQQRVGTGDLEAHLKLDANAAERPYFERMAGEYLAQVHGILADGFGHFSVAAAEHGTLIGADRTWQDYLATQLGETLKYLSAVRVLTPPFANEIERALHDHARLTSIQQGSLLHGDFHDANLIIDVNQKTIAAAVDLSQAKAGDPLFDIGFYATYHTDKRLPEFLEGYTSIAGNIPDLPQRIAYYDLRINLAKAKLRYRFGLQHRIPLSIDGMNIDLRELGKRS